MQRVAALFIVCFIITLNYNQVFSTTKADIVRQTKFPPCKACKTFVESFKRGMERTARGKFEGGDAAWEEEKLGSYAQSEIRLVEIQENVCADIEKGRDQCYSLHEEYDVQIEDWWLNHQQKQPDLFQYFCVDFLKYCCPEFHYGPDCKPCPGYPDKVCNNNGKCKGSATRKGNGECICNPGYIGKNCNSCGEKYFKTYKDDKTVLCAKCHHSCEGSCTKAGATGCEKCASGWLKDKDNRCLDINECAAPKSVCGPLQFCVNNDGSFRCLECDRACAGCTGDGPDMCIACASGYTLKYNICTETGHEGKRQYVFLTRYLTYLGLCVTTCIIFQRSVALAAVIGIAVAIYISVSEYMLNTPPMPNATEFANRLLQQN